jgi:hypothetical protein
MAVAVVVGGGVSSEAVFNIAHAGRFPAGKARWPSATGLYQHVAMGDDAAITKICGEEGGELHHPSVHPSA